MDVFTACLRRRVPIEWQMILVPDFMGYQIQSAELRPVLEHEFVMEGWGLINSYGR